MLKHGLFGWLVVCSAICSLPANSASTELAKTDLVAAITKARILSPGIAVNAELSKDQALVSTYRNLRANDDDCKIEAALIAKTLMELAPKRVNRVSVYFFSTANPQSYREVAVTAGDIKAFAAGQTNEKQLIGSLKLLEPQSTFLERQLMDQIYQGQLARRAPEVLKTVHDGVLEVKTDLEGQSQSDYELEAFKVARKCLEETGPAGIDSVKLLLSDPAKAGQVTTVVFPVEVIANLTTTIKAALNSVQIAEVKEKPAEEERYVSIVQNFPSGIVEIEKLDAAPGPLQEERAELLERIRQLDDQGVGVRPFAEEFVKVEEEINQVQPEQLKADILQLNAALDEQQRNLKASKEYHPVAVKGGAVASVSSKTAANNVPATLADLGGGDTKILEAKILQNPDGLIAYYERRLGRKGHPGEDHPNFPKILDFFSTTLRKANRIAEADKFEKRAEMLRQRRANTTSPPATDTHSAPANTSGSSDKKPGGSDGAMGEPQ